MTYTLSLLHTLLPKSLPSSTQPLLAKLANNPTFTRLRTALPPLTALLNEYRTLLRLSGLISITGGTLAFLAHPPPQPIPRALIAGKLLSIGVFQALENGVLLAGKGVLNWSPEKKSKATLWACQAWMVYTICELGRLGYEWRERDIRLKSRSSSSLTAATAAGEKQTTNESGKDVILAEDEKKTDTDDVAIRSEKEANDDAKWLHAWKRDLGVNLAYAPMTVHYSFGGGLLSEGPIAALGCVVAYMTMGEAWKASA